MAKSRRETDYEDNNDTKSKNIAPSRCVVENCRNPIEAEVHAGDYATALMMFRGIRRENVRSRRAGDEHFYVCAYHLEHDPRMARLQWQSMMF
jgi:hypothetical protein